MDCKHCEQLTSLNETGSSENPINFNEPELSLTNSTSNSEFIQFGCLFAFEKKHLKFFKLLNKCQF